MDSKQLDAGEKFWKTPELGERLLSMLDPLSTRHLIRSGVMDKKILQKSLSLKAWSELIRRSSYGGEGLLQMEDVQDLVRVLHFLELEEPSTYLLPLLDLICKSRPTDPVRGDHVDMICPNHPDNPHSITEEAFLLLEEVEGRFGTAVQSVESISVLSLKEPLLSALSARVARQREVLTSIYFLYVFCWDGAKSSVEAFTTLLQAQTVDVNILDIGGAIGGDGWGALAKSLKGKFLSVYPMFWCVFILKQDLSEAKKEDIKEIWDVTAVLGVFNTEDGVFSTEKNHLVVDHSPTFDWEQAWTRLQKISGMTEEEFNAECDQLDQQVESDEDAGSEGEGDEDDESEDQEHAGEEGDEEVI